MVKTNNIATWKCFLGFSQGPTGYIIIKLFATFLKNVYCNVHAENLQISISVSGSVIFVANISVIGIMENFHIGVPLQCMSTLATIHAFTSK